MVGAVEYTAAGGHRFDSEHGRKRNENSEPPAARMRRRRPSSPEEGVKAGGGTGKKKTSPWGMGIGKTTTKKGDVVSRDARPSRRGRGEQKKTANVGGQTGMIGDGMRQAWSDSEKRGGQGRRRGG